MKQDLTASYDPLGEVGETEAARLSAKGTCVKWIHYSTDIQGYSALPNHTKGKAADLRVTQRIWQPFESGKYLWVCRFCLGFVALHLDFRLENELTCR